MFWRTLVAVADIAAIAARFDALKTVLDERSRRLLAAAESQAVGKGGISIVSKATGISRPVIRQGLTDLKEPDRAISWTRAQRGRRSEESHR
jgi:DNA-binding phage protein